MLKCTKKSLIQSISCMMPVLVRIVEQGIGEGVMETPYPRETMEFLVASGQTIFDAGLFQWDAQEERRKILAFIHMMELTLGAEKGSFDFMLEILNGRYGGAAGEEGEA